MIVNIKHTIEGFIGHLANNPRGELIIVKGFGSHCEGCSGAFDPANGGIFGRCEIWLSLCNDCIREVLKDTTDGLTRIGRQRMRAWGEHHGVIGLYCRLARELPDVASAIVRLYVEISFTGGVSLEGLPTLDT